MRVFLAGATGVIGRPLLAALVRDGHEVAAMTRDAARGAALAAAGATPVVCDVFDREGLIAAVAAARPEVVLHQLTALPGRINPRKGERDLGPTGRLRTEGTRHLVAAARAAGARRLVTQSIAFIGRPGPGPPRSEADPVYADGPGYIRHVVGDAVTGERLTCDAEGLEGVALRYGIFYGPGTVYAADGSLYEDVSRRRVPLVGRGRGTFSFIHVDDAVSATLAVLGAAPPGVYNVVDDAPVAVATWLPAYAEALGARPPWRVPRWLARVAAGSYGVFLMDELPGVSNAKARALLDWAPARPTWRAVEAVLDVAPARP